jgi:DNA-directed RNA polymerase specialized sigma24 family protein
MPTSSTDTDALLLQELAWVRNLARRLLRDPSQVDDVVHDAWIAAHRRAATAPAPGFRAWLAAVVHNRVRRLARTDARRERRERAVAPAHEAPARSTSSRAARCTRRSPRR